MLVGAIQQCNNWTDIGVYLRVFESINPRVVQSANKLTAALSETVKSLDALRAKRESPNNEGNASSVEPCVSGLNEISRLPAEKDSEPVNSWNPSQWSRDVSQSSMSTTATPSPTSATSSAERSSYQKTSADAPSHQPPSAHPPASGNAEHEFDVPKGLSQLAGDSATSSYLGLCSSKTNKKTNNAHLNNIPVPGSKSTASSAALAKSASELPVVPSQRSTTQRAQRAPGALRFEPLEGPKREVSFDCHGESSYNFRTAAISETNIAPSQRGSFATSSCASGLPERETASKAYSVDELFRSLDIPEDTSPVAAALTLVARAIDVPVDDVKKIISSGDSGFNNKSMMPDRRRDSVLSQREDMSRSTIDCLLPMFSPVAQRTTEAGAYQSQPFCKNESKSCRVAGDGSSLNISAVYVNREDQDLCLEPQFQSKHVLKCSTTHLDSSQKTTRVCSSRQPSAVVPSSPIRTTCGVTPPIASGASSPLMSSFSDCPAFSHEATVQSSTTVRHSTGLRPEGFASHQRSMKGVSFDRSKRNWEASWLDARTGKRVKKCFSEGRWGSSARDMAILARKEAEDSGVISTRQQQFSPSLSCLSPERKNDHHSVPATITVGRPPQTEVVVAQRGSSRLLVPVSSDCDYDNSASISLSSSSRSRDQSAGGCATQERSHASSSRTLASVEDDLLLQQIAVRVANLFPQMALARASQQGVSEPSAGLKKETPEEQQACRRVRHDEKQNVSYSNHYPSCVAHLPLSAPPVQPLATPSSSSSLPSPPPASDSCSLSSPRLCAMPETAAAHNREPSAHATVRSARSSAHPENLVPTQSNGGYPVHYSTISSTAHHSTSLDCNKEHVSQASLSSDAVGSFKAALSLSEAVPTKVASSSPGSSLAPSGCVNNNENKSVSDGNICGGAEDIPSSVAVGNHQSVLLSYPSTTGQNSPVHEFYTHNKSTAPHYPCPSSQCSPQVQDNSFQSVYPDGDVAPLDSPSTFVPRVVQSSPPVRCELDSSSAPTERSTSAVADGKKKKEQGVPAFASLHQTIEDITPNISAPCSPVSTVLKLVHDYVSSSPNAAVSKNLHGNASSVLSVQQTSVSGMSDSTLAAPKMDSPKLQDLDEHVRSLWRKRQAGKYYRRRALCVRCTLCRLCIGSTFFKKCTKFLVHRLFRLRAVASSYDTPV